MFIDHGLLHWVQRAACAVLQAFDRDQFVAVDGRQEPDAGIDRAIADRVVIAPSDPSTTVQAPQSPSAQPSFVPLRPSVSRRYSSTVVVAADVARLDHLTVEQETDRLVGRHDRCVSHRGTPSSSTA